MTKKLSENKGAIFSCVSESTVLYAQPYNTAARGFYFGSLEEYKEQSCRCVDDYGNAVEEFEIEFIDGEEIDCALFEAVGVHQGNIGAFLEAVEGWSEDEKYRVIIAAGECGYPFNIALDNPCDFDVDLYYLDSMKELAEMFIDEGLFGDIPEKLQFYLDYDLIAHDLSMDYTETCIAGQRLIYRC